jgi:hypothetical protein
MNSKRIVYGQLHDYLTSLGYEREVFPTHVIYRTPEYELPIILPKTSRKDEVSSFNLTSVEGILKLDGVIGAEQFGVAPPPTRKPAKPKTQKTKARQSGPTKVDGVSGGGQSAVTEAPHKGKLAKPKAVTIKAKRHRQKGNLPKVEQG